VGQGGPLQRRRGGDGAAGGDRRRPPRPRPLRRYGQNHLVDGNVLAAIVEQAAVRPDDVVLEVGAAAGRLTRPLLERAAVVHAYEIDRRFSAALEELAAAAPNLRLHFGDALRDDLSRLSPPPTALVANLAYNIAIPLIMESILVLPSVRRWAVMVQRELGERLFAAPGSKPYAAVSVLTQAACRLERVRAVPASAFRPRPRVDSSFVTFVRRDPAETPPPPTAAQYRALDPLVRRAFAQRRKLLANSLAGSAVRDPAGRLRVLARDDIVAALARLGRPPASRPEELAPDEWLRFAVSLGAVPATGHDEAGEDGS